MLDNYKHLLDCDALAGMLGITVDDVRRSVSEGLMPGPAVIHGGLRLWSRLAVLDWLQQNCPITDPERASRAELEAWAEGYRAKHGCDPPAELTDEQRRWHQRACLSNVEHMQIYDGKTFDEVEAEKGGA